MRVVLFHEFFDFAPKYEAAARRNRAFAKVLASCGLQVLVIVPGLESRSPQEQTDTSYQVKYLRTAHAIRQRVSLMAAVGHLAQTARQLAREVERFQAKVLMVAAHWPLMELEAALAARMARVPLILDLHDSWLITRLTRPTDRLRELKVGLERLVCQQAAAISVVSTRHAQLIATGYGVAPECLNVVYNGVMSREGLAPRGRRKLYDLVHLGPPRTYYDTPRLLKAIALTVRNGLRLRALFLGCSDDDQYTRGCIRQCQLLGIEQLVEFKPPVPPAEVPEVLAQCRIGLHSLMEHPIYECAVALKVVEYLRAGLPVAALVSDTSEIHDIIQSHQCGFTASNPQSYAQRLSALLSSPDEMKTMAKAALAASEQFCWEKTIGQFCKKVLMPLAAGNSRRGPGGVG